MYNRLILQLCIHFPGCLFLIYTFFIHTYIYEYFSASYISLFKVLVFLNENLTTFSKPDLVKLENLQVASSSLGVAAVPLAALSAPLFLSRWHQCVHQPSPVQCYTIPPPVHQQCTSTGEKESSLSCLVCVSCELWPTCYFRSLPPPHYGQK